MEPYKVKVKEVEKITHDVLRIVTEKPSGFTFTPGQATEVAINKTNWQSEKRPFTFTSLPNDQNLEFTIKTYPSHKGVTNELLNLKVNDELIIGDAWGTISYKGEGVFIAGGAGVTPFISIFRALKSKSEIGANRLIFANKKRVDIIHEEEFKKMLKDHFFNILSDEDVEHYSSGYISEEFLKDLGVHNAKHIYLCGPKPMMQAVESRLNSLGVDKKVIVKEEF